MRTLGKSPRQQSFARKPERMKENPGNIRIEVRQKLELWADREKTDCDKHLFVQV